MQVMYAIFVFIGLSLDSFVLMMNEGARLPKLTLVDTIKYALIFGVTALCASLLGALASLALENVLVDSIEITIGCLVIFTLGSYIIYKSVRMEVPEEKIDKDFNTKKCLQMAIFTSVDILFLGMCFGLLEIGIPTAVILCSVTTFITVLVALQIGYHVGSGYNRIVAVSGGALMIIFAVTTLIVYIMHM